MSFGLSLWVWKTDAIALTSPNVGLLSFGVTVLINNFSRYLKVRHCLHSINNIWKQRFTPLFLYNVIWFSNIFRFKVPNVFRFLVRICVLLQCNIKPWMNYVDVIAFGEVWINNEIVNAIKIILFRSLSFEIIRFVYNVDKKFANMVFICNISNTIYMRKIRRIYVEFENSILFFFFLWFAVSRIDNN